MPGPNKKDGFNTVIIKSISFALVFFAVVVIIIAAMFIFSVEGEFLAALSGRISLKLSFYVSTLVVLFVSSILFTPFSFGIANYFINSKTGDASFSQIFYLFSKPRLLLKAVYMNFLKKIFINIYNIAVIVVAVVAECGIFVISIILSGENIFDYEKEFVDSVITFMSSDPFFITLTIIEWVLVICVFVYVHIKFSMCKYVLIANSNVGPLEAIKIGRFAIEGLIFKTLIFYFKFLSIYIFTFVTLGLVRAIAKSKSSDSFSTYALRIVTAAIPAYYDRLC